MATILRGGTVLPMNAATEVIANGEVVIDGSRISAVGPAGSGAGSGDEIIDCRGTAVLPGLVNVHTHACTGFFRGLVEDVSRGYWASGYTLPFQDRFGIEDYRLTTEAACLELLRNGVTCIADRFAHMDVLGQVIEASGIRAVITHTIADAAGDADWETALKVLDRWGSTPASRVSAGVGPHALDTCSDDLLSRAARIGEERGCRVFLHVAQSDYEVAALRRRGYSGALDCLERNGLRGPNVVAAHCIYLSEDELERWPESGIAIAHCPASNLKVEARTPPIARLKQAGVPVGLGTDWTASNNAMDLFLEMRIAGLVGKLKADDPTSLPVTELMRMATIEGAEVLGLDSVIGTLEVGKRADVIVVDLTALGTQPVHNVVANLVYSATGANVRDVFVDGVPLVRGGRATSAREAAVVEAVGALRDRVAEA